MRQFYASETTDNWRATEPLRILDEPRGDDSRFQEETWKAVVPYDMYREMSQPRHLLMIHVPSCPETMLSAQCAEMLFRFSWHQRSTGLVPIRIGYNRSLDLAVSSLLEAQKSVAFPSTKGKADSIRLYLEAIGSVQTMMSVDSNISEELELALSILSAYESTNGASLRYMFAHKQGLLTLLLRHSQATEVVRAIAYDEMIAAHLAYSARGIRSKFDTPFWLDLDPPPALAPTIVLARLRRVAFRLFIVLPGLAVLVRSLRNEVADSAVVQYALALAQQYIAESDSTAENLLLHSVRVTKPRHPSDMYVVPVVLKFGSLVDFEAAAYYWQTRILLNRLCLQLQRLCTERPYFDVDAIKLENCRMAKNLLMSWESAFDYGAFGTERGGAGTMTFSVAMIAVWGVLVDVETFQGHSSDEIRDWVLGRFRMLQNGGVPVVQGITAEHVDGMADLFAGGPVQGLLPFLMGQIDG